MAHACRDHAGRPGAVLGASDVIVSGSASRGLASVLIIGETGTGKELAARAVHNASPRRDKLFVPISCAALPAELLESELFGYERGAFSGAVKEGIGKFEFADGGTIFLDELTECRWLCGPSCCACCRRTR